MNRLLMILAMMMVVLAACSPTAVEPAAEDVTPADVENDTLDEPALSTVEPDEPVGDENAPTAIPEEEEIAPEDLGDAIMPESADRSDELTQQILADLAERLDVEVDQIELLGLDSVVWRDGSLGCPQPDTMYTQALVPGYRVKLEVFNQVYEYHTDESSTYIYCATPSEPVTMPPAPEE